MYSSIVKEFADTSIHNIWGRNMKISLSPTKLTGVNQQQVSENIRSFQA